MTCGRAAFGGRMEKIAFSRAEEWPFVKVKIRRGVPSKWREDRADNDDVFLCWLTAKLRGLAGRSPDPAKGERLNALALYANGATCDYLDKHVSGYIYLCYSPKQDDALGDGELGVDTERLIVREDA